MTIRGADPTLDTPAARLDRLAHYAGMAAVATATATLPPCAEDPDGCRFKAQAERMGMPDMHTCTNRDGHELQPGQVCWREARAQTLELADLDSIDTPYPARADEHGDRQARTASPAPWPARYQRLQYSEEAVCVNCRGPIERHGTSGTTWISNGQLRDNLTWGAWKHIATGQADCHTDKSAAA